MAQSMEFPQIYTTDSPDFSLLESLPSSSSKLMDDWESAFIIDLIKQHQPLEILEVGVAGGGTTALILSAIEQLKLNSSLTSVELLTVSYLEPDKKAGYEAMEKFGEPQNWKLFTGHYLPELIEKLDKKFDFIILDTAHIVPGEILDYLVALPFIKENSIIVLHDVVWHLCSIEKVRTGYATRVLFDACVGNKIVALRNGNIANIAAFQVTSDTFKYVENVFGALAMKWAYGLPDHVFFLYYNFYFKYYGEQAARWFGLCRSWNERVLAEDQTVPAPKPRRRTKKELAKVLIKKTLKYFLPYGLVRVIQKNR